MRLNIPFWAPNSKNARRYQREPVRFQMLLPLTLRKAVSGKGDITKEAVCMQEMAVLFACFKKSDFNQRECLKEVGAFQNCYNEYSARAKVQREMGKKGILVPGEKKLTHRQLNQLLKGFPPLN